LHEILEELINWLCQVTEQQQHSQEDEVYSWLSVATCTFSRFVQNAKQKGFRGNLITFHFFQLFPSSSHYLFNFPFVVSCWVKELVC
jgi:hypothetical protein